MPTERTSSRRAARLQWVGLGALPAAVRDPLIGPGAPFEMRVEDVLGRRLEVFVQRPRTLRALLDATVHDHGDLPFLVAGNRTWTFARAAREIDALGRVLVDAYGIRPGDRVAIVAANSPEHALLMWAVLSIGAIVTGLNGWWTGPELEYGIALTEPKVIAGDEPRLARLASTAIPDGTTVTTIADLSAMASDVGDPCLPPTPVGEDDPAVVLFTSGTTGRPKGATLSHRNIVNFVMTSKLYGALGRLAARPATGAPASAVPTQPATIVASPMFHVSGMLAVLMTGGALGAKLVVPPPGRWDPATHLELTQQHGVTMWSGVPTQYWRLLRRPDLDSYDLRTVTTVSSGGAPYPPDLVRALREHMPWATLGNGYGMSETVGLGARINGEAMVATPDSVGPANIGTEIEIRDPFGSVAAEGEVGEIHLRTASVFLGYWNDPDATRASLDEDGWYRTGDFGRIENGMLHLDSRVRDLIIRGGENVYPVEIEHRLVEHPDIDDAAVIGVDHAELGQEVKAFVVPAEGCVLTAADVRSWAAQTLAPFKIPEYVELRANLPYTESGKVMKHLLEQQERDAP